VGGNFASPFFGIIVMNRARFAAFAGFFLITWYPTAICAQYFPIAGVPGLRAMNIEIAGNMMRNSARQGGAESREARQSFDQIKRSTVVATNLIYKPSIERRKQNLANFVRKTRATDPHGAAKMETFFASNDVIVTLDKVMRTVGLRAANLADAYSVYWSSAWHASVGSTETPSREQFANIKSQAGAALLNVPAIANATEAAKQEFAEALLVQAALIDASMEAAQGDSAQIKAVGRAVRQGAQAMGLDLTSMTLTADGFVSSTRETGAIKEDDAVQLASESENQGNSSSPNYALIAAAGGAGLGGMFLLGKAMGRKS
jgi:hypothetical protein